jgi:hypothetical protein
MLPRTLEAQPPQDEPTFARLIPGTYIIWCADTPDEVETGEADPHQLVIVTLAGGPLDGEEVRLPLGIVLPSGCTNWKRKEDPAGQQP